MGKRLYERYKTYAKWCTLVGVLLIAVTSCPEPFMGKQNAGLEGNGKKALLFVNIGDTKNRIVMPEELDILNDKEMSIELRGISNDEDESFTKTWNAHDSVPAYTSMTTDNDLQISPGLWNFFLIIKKNNVDIFTFEHNQKIYIDRDNRLSFYKLKTVQNAHAKTDDCFGKFSITIHYPAQDDVMSVTAALYNQNEKNGEQGAPEKLSITKDMGSRCVVFQKENIPEGSYVVKFSLYSDLDATKLINEYEELVLIAPNKCSSTERVIEDVKRIYKEWEDQKLPPVSNLETKIGDAQITLMWKNPVDADFNHVIIKWRKADAAKEECTVANQNTYTVKPIDLDAAYVFTVITADADNHEYSSTTVEYAPYHFSEVPVWLPKGANGSSGNNAISVYAFFGDWPQTLKKDSVSIIESVRKNGYYLGDDGYYYEKMEHAIPFDGISFPNSEGLTFKDGTLVEKGKSYFFKVEPIKWRLVTSNYYDINGAPYAFLVAENILTSGIAFGPKEIRTVKGDTVYPNDYNYSGIRAYLNGYDGREYGVDNYTGCGFLQKAFTSEALDKILKPHLDTHIRDSIFLPSYKEMTSFSYKNDEMRRRVATDYAKAAGLGMDHNYDTGWWWLRSPDENDSKGDKTNISYIFGSIMPFETDMKDGGIVPVLCFDKAYIQDLKSKGDIWFDTSF